MNKIKYISLEKLKKQLKAVIEDVYMNNTEYIVMVNKEPKVKITAIDGKEGKELVFEETVKDEKLKKFVE